jgi:hypothetical protein
MEYSHDQAVADSDQMHHQMPDLLSDISRTIPRNLLLRGAFGGNVSCITRRAPARTLPNGSLRDYIGLHGTRRIDNAMSLQVKENGLDGKQKDQT